MRPLVVAAVIVIAIGVTMTLLHERKNTQRTPTVQSKPGSAISVSATRGQDLVQTGELVIKGAPWGEVLEVTDSSGRNRVPGKPLYTPAVLTLPSGLYKVQLYNPNSERTVTLNAEVKQGNVATCSAKLDDVDPALYLQRVSALQ